MLLIVDDIQVGCGRTGTFFSFEAAGIRPDIITLSKSLSGFGLPMSLVLMKPELDVWKPGAHSGTFRGNNLAFVTATQALETYWTNAAFSAEIQRKESLVRDWLENLVHSFPNAGLSVRGRGLIQGLVSNASPALANRIAKRAFGKGVVIETSGAQDEVLAAARAHHRGRPADARPGSDRGQRVRGAGRRRRAVRPHSEIWR